MEITRENAKDRLREFRDRNGKTLADVCLKSGVSISTLIAIEKGTAEPQSKTIYKLNQYLGSFPDED